MIELARHLMEDGSHAALPFHPACPACREERLAGRIESAPLMSARTRAGLAAAVLAASATAPAAALATTPVPEVEGDEETEGGAAPGAEGPAGIELPPGVDVPTTPTIEEPGSPAGGGGDDGALEGDTPADPDPVEPAEPAESLGTGEPPAAPAAPAAPQAPPAAVPPAVAPPEVEAKAEPKPAKRAGTKLRRASAPAPAPVPVVPQAAASVPATQPTAAPAAASTAPGRDAEVHVVESGESLWSIARGRLGGGATNAAIAREVQRIWNLNADAIGTGDPDLLITGQKLRLQ